MVFTAYLQELPRCIWGILRTDQERLVPDLLPNAVARIGTRWEKVRFRSGKRPPICHLLGFLVTQRDGTDRSRKPVLYPLSYGAGGTEDTPPLRVSPADALSLMASRF